MKQIAALIAAMSIAAAPAVAQDDTPETDLSQGAEMLSEGAKMIFRGLMAELEPAARDSWAALVDLIDDIALYHPPEVLPNGDIIIRRKVPLEPEIGEGGEADI